MLHAYCIRRAGDAAPPPDLGGIDGAAVRLIAHGALGIWISDGGATRPTVERLRAHDRVIRMAMRSTTPLPIRFGSEVNGEDALHAFLDERGADFLETLERIGQRVEMGIRVAHGEQVTTTGPDGCAVQGVGDAPGRAYLETRKRAFAQEAEKEREAESVLAAIEEDLADLELPTVRTVIARDGMIGNLAHLLQRPTVGVYRNRAGELQKRRRDLRITTTGPWAPYSFV